MPATVSPRPSLTLSGRPLPSTPRALGAELAALLERLGVHAVVTDASGTILAAPDDVVAQLREGTLVPQESVAVRLCGQSFCVVLPPGGGRAPTLDLTPRQRVVVELIAQGLRNREIADQLGISLHTVRRHVEALLRRLNVPTRAAAAVLLRETLRSSRPTATPRRVA
jgi:DNA-binding CsgD family transcriptional regulator